MSRAIEKNLFVWLLCALAPIGLFGFVSQHQTSKVVNSNEWVVHTHEVKEELDAILFMLNTAETSVRGFVITGKEEFLEGYLHASPLIEEHIKRLGSLIADNSDQLRRLHGVQPLIVEKLDRLGSIIMVRKEKGLQRAADIVSTGDGLRLMGKINEKMEEMQTEENKLLATRSSKTKSDSARASNIATILTVFALILIACNVFFARLRM